MASCGIAQLVSDTRFFTEDTLLTFFESLINATETGDGMADSGLLVPSTDSTCDLNDLVVISNDSKTDDTKSNAMNSIVDNNVVESNLKSIMASVSDLQLISTSVDFISASSISWLENLLVEASLRNRDRLSLFWNLLVRHYEKTILAAVVLTYPLERYVRYQLFFILICYTNDKSNLV